MRWLNLVPIVALALASCGRRDGGRANTEMAPMDERQGAAASDACAEALQALTSGALDRWHGLPAGCDRERLVQVLTLDTPPAAGQPGFSGYASYLPTAG